MQHDVLALANLQHAVEALQHPVDQGLLFVPKRLHRLDDDASLSSSTSTSTMPFAFSVLPVDTRSQMYSARPSFGAISTAPEKYTASALMPFVLR